MSKNLQVRGVPAVVHQSVRARAIQEGMTVSDWILSVVRQALKTPPQAQVFEQLSKRKEISVSSSPAQIIRELRDAR